MNAAPVILLSAVLATGAGVATSLALRPEPAPAAQAGGVAPGELGALRGELAALRQELGELRAGRADALPAPRSAARVDAAEVERAVARYFESLGAGGAASAQPAEPAAEEPPASELDLAALLDDLLTGELDEGGRQALWERIRAAGELDEAIALLERRAEERANDPDAQVDVAAGYIQKIFEVGDGPQAGLWAGKADAAYDRALKLDPKHWEARFSKAVSLSFWPPIFGKQGEAITHFETLVEQQKGMPLQDSHAQTYLLLGNLYTQTGQNDKAQAIWSQGLALFPDDASLGAKLGGQ